MGRFGMIHFVTVLSRQTVNIPQTRFCTTTKSIVVTFAEDRDRRAAIPPARTPATSCAQRDQRANSDPRASHGASRQPARENRGRTPSVVPILWPSTSRAEREAAPTRDVLHPRSIGGRLSERNRLGSSHPRPIDPVIRQTGAHAAKPRDRRSRKMPADRSPLRSVCYIASSRPRSFFSAPTRTRSFTSHRASSSLL